MKNLIFIAVLSALAVSQVSCGKCESKFTEWGAWSHGRNGELKFPVPDHTAKWRINIVFDSPVNSIDAWEGKKEKCSLVRIVATVFIALLFAYPWAK